tara:strand:- start:89 stop:1144 length:1056 start_codon:yes stop_codon:yes gene_type:complete
MQIAIGIGSAYYNGDDWAEVVDYTIKADKLGIDFVWSAEAWGMDAVVPLAFLAAKTKNIKLGTGIIQISSRVPAMIAMTAQSLSTVSSGRFSLGLGVSGPQVVEGLHGVEFSRPVTRLEECAEIIKKAIAGQKIEYSGKHYQLPRLGGEGKAIKLSQTIREIPIYFATLGPKALELTGRIADGWLGTAFVPEHANIFLDHLKKGAQESGRTISDIDIQVGGSFELGEDIERMVEERKPAMAFTLGAMGSAKTNFYNDAFKRAGYVDEAIEVQKLWVDGKREEAVKRVPDEMIFKTNFLGTEEMIHERLTAFRKAGVTTLRIQTKGGSWKEKTESLEEAMDLVARHNRLWKD